MTSGGRWLSGHQNRSVFFFLMVDRVIRGPAAPLVREYRLILAGQEEEFLITSGKLLHPHPVAYFPHVNISRLSDGNIVSII